MIWIVSTKLIIKDIPLLAYDFMFMRFYFGHPGSSSDSDEMSLSDEAEEEGPDIPACTPLAAFLSFKQEAEKRRASQVQMETTGKVAKLYDQLDWAAQLID